MAVEQRTRLDSGLKDLAVLAAAAGTACSSCLDSGYWASEFRRQVLEEKIRTVPRWPDGEVFTRLELLVMLYAEAMTMSPPLAAGALVAELCERLGEEGLAELSAIVTTAPGQTGQSGLD
jgi:alkylhydroperoxidase family enzyme